MSLAAMTWAVEAPIERPTAKLALVCLADHADEDGACFPSQKALAAKVGVSERALRDALVWLEDNGFIERTARHRKDGSRTSDAYQLPPEAYRKNFPHPRKQTQTQPEDSAGLTTFEPVTEPTTTAARPGDLLDKLLDAAGIKGNPNPSLAFPGEIIGLQQAGFDLDADILPAIRARPNPRARSWAYFVPQIREAAERRFAAASTPKPLAPAVDWPARLKVFNEGGVWGAWGPRPGESGCQAPADLIQQARAAA